MATADQIKKPFIPSLGRKADALRGTTQIGRRPTHNTMVCGDNAPPASKPTGS